jgi:NTE family protein
MTDPTTPDAVAPDAALPIPSATAVATGPDAPSTWPVEMLPGEEPEAPPPGTSGLCLSGGGSRAMLFHVGALIRLNELGLLGKLDRISSVSGGSIVAGVLGARWRSLTFDPKTGIAANFAAVVAEPIMAFASENVDIPSAVWGVVLPTVSAAERFTGILRDKLFGALTLQGLPKDGEGPRFVINATNLQSGALWRFTQRYTWDWKVGKIDTPTIPLATAVAASAAFPPFFSPVRLDFEPGAFVPGSGEPEFEDERFQRRVMLADGGVYDNLGLETVYKRVHTVYVSDGGGKMDANPTPDTDWIRQPLRVMKVIDNQVRSLRKRLLIAGYDRGDRDGAYWGIRSAMAEAPAPDTLPCPPNLAEPLAEMATRLSNVPVARRRQLANWGYAIADASIRYRAPGQYPPARFPYPGGVG